MTGYLDHEKVQTILLKEILLCWSRSGGKASKEIFRNFSCTRQYINKVWRKLHWGAKIFSYLLSVSLTLSNVPQNVRGEKRFESVGLGFVSFLTEPSFEKKKFKMFGMKMQVCEDPAKC